MNSLSILLCFICGLSLSFSQNNLDLIDDRSKNSMLIDGIFAIIGNDAIFHSDITNQLLQYQTQNSNTELDMDSLKELVVQELFFQKILIHFAGIDSVEIDANEIESNIQQRIDFFEEQLGSVEKVEDYFDKSIHDLNDDLMPIVRNQLLTQKMQYEILKDIDVSPGEVKDFYKNLDADSIPIVSTQYQIAQILKIPDAASLEIEETLSKLEELRNRILKGADFSTMAILYSEDPGSSRNGGAYLNIKKGYFVKEFEGVAFSLGVDEVSEVFETEYGYHIAQLIDRRGNEIDVRHILMTPKISHKEMLKSKIFLQSLKIDIIEGVVPFSEAVKEFSSDLDTRYNGGLLINPNTNNSFFSISDLETVDSALLNEIGEMNAGDLTDPMYVKLPSAKEAYRIIKLVSKKPEHVATFENDYSFLKNYYYRIKERKQMNEWYKDKIEDVYINSFGNLDNYKFYHDLLK